MKVKIYKNNDSPIINCKINNYKFIYHTPKAKSFRVPKTADKLFAQLLMENKEQYIAITRWGKLVGALELRDNLFFQLHSIKRYTTPNFLKAVFLWQNATDVKNAMPTYNGMYTIEQENTILDDFLPF